MGSFQITTISIIILGLSFVTRLLKLFETTSRFLTNEIRARMSLRLRKALASCVKLRLAPRNRRSVFKFRIVLLENPLLACYLFLRIFVDIYASVFSDVWPPTRLGCLEVGANITIDHLGSLVCYLRY
jgi:hypothetical protein